MGFFVNGLVNLRIEDHLSKTVSIPQIHKDNPTVITAAQDPAH
jgi:hypothetical protein